MSKIRDNLRSHLIAYIVTAIIAAIIGTTIVLLFYFLNSKILRDLSNGFTIAFASLVGLGGLMWLANLGAFDTLSYGFMQLFTSAFAKKANKYNDYAGWSHHKKMSRSTSAHLHFSFILVGLLFAIGIIVVEIIIHS